VAEDSAKMGHDSRIHSSGTRFIDEVRSMRNRRKSVYLSGFLITIVCCLLSIPLSEACTRVVYLGPDGNVITARSMDWKVDVGTNLWILPRGISRTGEAGPHSAHWTSKYGSVIATGYDISTTDGMNEKGLVANVLWLVESEYPQPKSTKPMLAISIWAQYVLDNFATVAEAIDELQKEPFTVVTAHVPGEDRLATLHLSISDATGDSAIVEYIDGKQVIHHDGKYQVMTNSPTFDKQLALNEYWKSIGGAVMLPGTNRAADRFARASFYINAIPKDESPDITVASVFSVIRNVSVPYGITTPDQPNISSTRWRTVSDQKRKIYFFESALTPNTFWIDFKDVDFSSESGKVMKLDLGPNQSHVYAGNVAKDFKVTKPFRFLGL
jgi:penicillin V acylase-like amidase (Ntn superfamily)